jgi:hypothetical protein
MIPVHIGADHRISQTASERIRLIKRARHKLILGALF